MAGGPYHQVTDRTDHQEQTAEQSGIFEADQVAFFDKAGTAHSSTFCEKGGPVLPIQYIISCFAAMNVPAGQIPAIEEAEPGSRQIAAVAAYVQALGGRLEIVADMGADRMVLR